MAFPPPKACRGAPEGLPRAAPGRLEPARERARTAQGLPRAAPGLPRSFERPVQGRVRAHRACLGPRQTWQGLPRAATGLPRSSGRPAQGHPWLAQYAWTARRCHKTAAAILRSAQRPQTMPKKRPNMLESTLDVQAQCFVPWRRREAELDTKLYCIKENCYLK